MSSRFVEQQAVQFAGEAGPSPARGWTTTPKRSLIAAQDGEVEQLERPDVARHALEGTDDVRSAWPSRSAGGESAPSRMASRATHAGGVPRTSRARFTVTARGSACVRTNFEQVALRPSRPCQAPVGERSSFSICASTASTSSSSEPRARRAGGLSLPERRRGRRSPLPRSGSADSAGRQLLRSSRGRSRGSPWAAGPGPQAAGVRRSWRSWHRCGQREGAERAVGSERAEAFGTTTVCWFSPFVEQLPRACPRCRPLHAAMDGIGCAA